MSILQRNTKKTTVTATDEAVQVEAAETKAVKKPRITRKAASKKDIAKAEAAPTAAKSVSALAAQTILSPLVTEKSAHLADAGVYAFLVATAANRVAVSQAFRSLYNVTPVKVNIIRVHGKEHRFGGVTSRASDWKKALVTVPKGTRIDIFEKI